MSAHKAPRAPLRVRIPFVMDTVIVFAADHIRQIEASDDVGPMHALPTSTLPRWLMSTFPSTRYYDVDRDRWFCAFEPAMAPGCPERRSYQARQMASGYRPDDVVRLADLLSRDADDEELGHALVQIVVQRFVDGEIPRSVTDAAARAATTTLEVFLQPWSRPRTRRAQQEVSRYCAHAVKPEAHSADIGHHLGNAVHVMLPALRHVTGSLDQPVEQVLAENAPTSLLPRIALKASTLGGLLRKPAVPGRTVIFYKIGDAAAETGDMLFVFAAGLPDRYCSGKDFVLNLMKDVHRELRARRQAPEPPRAEHAARATRPDTRRSQPQARARSA
jgi:hypothetical protein